MVTAMRGMTDLAFDLNSMELLYSEKSIRAAVSELGSRIEADFGDRELVIIAMLDSALFFAADLVRTLKSHVSIDFLKISGYGSEGETGGEIRVLKDITADIKNKNVLLVDVLAESGLTLDFAAKHLCGMNPSCIKICVLLDCAEMRLADVSPDYAGIVCNAASFAGYGLDIDGRFRNMPCICRLSEI